MSYSLSLRENIKNYLRDRTLIVYKIEIDFEGYKCYLDINFDDLKKYLQHKDIEYTDHDLMVQLIDLTTSISLSNLTHEQFNVEKSD